jgi:CubicO group peptidase (beta-lactamase class C family)
MRVMSREQPASRSELIRHGRQLAIAVSMALSLAACGGGGGGGGGQTAAPVQQQPQNAAPTVQAGTDQTIELPTASAQLTGSATDDTAQTLTYTWTATSGPSGVTFGTASAAATSVTFPSAGAYVLTLSVSDGSLSATDTVSVTVNAATYPASDTTNDTADHGWTRVAAAADVGMTQSLLDQAANYAQTSGRSNPADNAGMIVRRGRIVASWGDIDKRYDMKSTTKSMGGIALGIALDNRTIALSDTAVSRYSAFGAKPVSNLSTGFVDDVTIQQLATHTAGFSKYAGWGISELDTTTSTFLYQPGTTWFYSDSGLNWLAEVLTTVFNEDLATVLGTRVWTALGLNSSYGPSGGGSTSDVHWRNNANRDQTGLAIHNRELASGIFANANAMARVGLLFLRKGVWANDQRIVSEEFVTTVKTPVAANASLTNPRAADFPGATTNYGLLWWTNANGQLPNVPRDAFWAWGLGDSLIVVIPSLDIVVVRAGAQFIANPDPSLGVREWNDADWNGDYAVLAPFLDPIVQSVIP